MEGSEKEERPAMRPFEYLRLILDVVVIIVMMVGVRGLIPDLLFYPILFTLGLVVFLALLNMYGKSWFIKINVWQKERKRTTIAKENFAEFKDHVEKFRQATYPLREIRDKLRDQLRTLIEEKQMKEFGLLPIYLIESFHAVEIENLVGSIQRRFNEFNGTFTHFFSFVREFELIIENSHKRIEFLSIFAKEMAGHTEINAPFGRIKTEYEEFREQYNSFLNDYTKFIHKLNRDLNENVFSEYFNHIRKW